MKRKYTKIKTLIVASLLVLGVNEASAQAIFEDDFEGGSLAAKGWIITQGAAADAQKWQESASDPVTPAGNYGPECVVSRSWLSGTDLQADDYLITPRMDFSTVTASKLTLTYFFANSPNGWKDDHDVLISIDSSDIASFTTTLQSVPGSETDVYQRIEIDLSSYIGEDSVYIAFHHTSNGQEYLLLDDIKIAEPANFDGVLGSVEIQNRYDYTPISMVGDVDFSAKLINLGIKKISTSTVKGSIGGANGTVVKTNVASLDTVVARGSIPLSFAPLGNLLADFSLTIDSTDENIGNNSQDDVFVTEVTEAFYSRYDTTYVKNMTATGFSVEFSYFNVLSATIVSDNGFLTSDDASGLDIISNRFGNVYDFPKAQNLKKVLTYLSPSSTGQKIWLEIYNYDNITNTVGDSIKPVYVGEKLLIPSTFTTLEVNEFIFDLGETGIILDNGKYVICVGEESNTAEKSIGMIANLSHGFFEEWYVPNTSYFNSKVDGAEDINNVWNELILTYSTSTESQNAYLFYNIALELGESTIGIDEHDLTSSLINVFPNPTNGEVNVSILSDDFKAQSIQVLDIAGRNVKSINGIVGKKNINFDMSSFDAGVYFIQIQNGEQTITNKVILK